MPYKDKKKQREYQNRWMQKRRRDWLQANGPCVQCGSWTNLHVDHRNPEEKVEHKIWSWSKQRRDEELAKCQVLCKVCHERKTSQENRELNTKPVNHGTYYAYKERDCRCELCKQAYSLRRHRWYLNRKRKNDFADAAVLVAASSFCNNAEATA